MPNITNSADLKSAILSLEVEREMHGILLKEQFQEVYTTLTPANLLRGTLSDVISSPNLGRNIVGAGISLLTGYLTRRFIVGNSTNIFKRILGDIVQIGVTKLVAKNSSAIESAGESIFKRIFKAKE